MSRVSAWPTCLVKSYVSCTHNHISRSLLGDPDREAARAVCLTWLETSKLKSLLSSQVPSSARISGA